MDFFSNVSGLSTSYLSNTASQYLTSIVILIVALIVFKIFQQIVLTKLEKLAAKTKTDIDDTFVTMVNSVKPSFYFFLAFYIAVKTLVVSTLLSQILTVILIVWAVYIIIAAVQILISYLVQKRVGSETDKGSKTAANALGLISKIILWSVALLFILSNLGINITSLVAGLGVGGIAIAFALQNILGDLFSSFAIYFDKPFTVGDFIIVGDHMGVVEKIGIKTTRMKALQGEEIVISNTELTSSRIRNFKHMSERRIPVAFGVTYDTSAEKLRKIPELVKTIIDSVDGARFDRSHFKHFAESSLDFETVYYVSTGDYAEYMTINQAIHLGIKEAFDSAKIDMAFPTRTLYIEKNG